MIKTIRRVSYYGLYLLKYLRENHPDRASDTDFIEERADHAADVYEQSRLEGATPEGAQELAMAALLQDLHFPSTTPLSKCCGTSLPMKCRRAMPLHSP